MAEEWSPHFSQTFISEHRGLVDDEANSKSQPRRRFQVTEERSEEVRNIYKAAGFCRAWLAWWMQEDIRGQARPRSSNPILSLDR